MRILTAFILIVGCFPLSLALRLYRALRAHFREPYIPSVEGTVNFYLVPTEGANFEPRACRVLRRVHSELREELALVTVSPSLPPGTFIHPITQEIHLLALSVHGRGNLFGPTKFPVYVDVWQVHLLEGEAPQGNKIATRFLCFGDVHGSWASAQDAYQKMIS